VKRRTFITLPGGAAVAWPLAARAQQAGKVPRIGFLGMASPSTFALRLEAFRLGLRDFGYIEGTTVNVEYRWAEGRYERLPGLAAELIRSKVDLIVTHGTPGSLAAKRATTTIPIVMASIGDPVADRAAQGGDAAPQPRGGHPQRGQSGNRSGIPGDGDDGAVAQCQTATIPTADIERAGKRLREHGTSERGGGRDRR